MKTPSTKTAKTTLPARRETTAIERPQAISFGASTKLRDHHRDRLAIVYIRQSSPQQVLENRESRERQYALAEAGWPALENFETGLTKTVQWYLDNPTWWKPLREEVYNGSRLGVIDGS